MNRITHFAYEYDFLSNFFPVVTRFEGVDYATVEHAYQAAKTLDPEKRRIFSFEFNPNLSAGQAKRVGQNLDLREDWDKVKVSVMRELLRQKFSDSVLHAKLRNTGDAHLEEGNWWEDRYWGVCYGGLLNDFGGRKCKAWPHEPTGENMLGKLLMDVRQEISGEG